MAVSRKKIEPHIEQTEQAKEKAPRPIGKTITTGLNLDTVLHTKLKTVALKRSTVKGGRISVSAVVVDVLETYLDDYERSL